MAIFLRQYHWIYAKGYATRTQIQWHWGVQDQGSHLATLEHLNCLNISLYIQYTLCVTMHTCDTEGTVYHQNHKFLIFFYHAAMFCAF